MSPISPLDTLQITAIAEEVFTAMIDGEPGGLVAWPGDSVEFADPMHAWVEMHGAYSGRAVLTTEAATADDLARALLQMGADEPVSDADLVDAFGEVANVVGGNLKSLLAMPDRLTLPEVGRTAPSVAGATRIDSAVLSWRGRALDVSVWQI